MSYSGRVVDADEKLPMCAPGSVGARACSISFAIALPEVVSSHMKMLHSVVLRCAVQYLLG